MVDVMCYFRRESSQVCLIVRRDTFYYATQHFN